MAQTLNLILHTQILKINSMKRLILLAMLGFAFSVAPSAKAQVSVNVNIGSRPPVYRYVDYGYNYGYVAPRPIVVHQHVYKAKHRPHVHYRAPKKYYKKSYKRYDNHRRMEYRRYRN